MVFLTRHRTRSFSFALSLLASLALNDLASANNGAVATAQVIEHKIKIDGDFSDWPEDAWVYPIMRHGQGNVLTENDLKAQFRVAVNRELGFIYLAVEVFDDSHVYDSRLIRDRASVYFEINHGRSGTVGKRYNLNADEGITTRDRVKSWALHEPGKNSYEWQCKFEAPPGDEERSFTCAFDIKLSDHDADGSFSTAYWGPQSSETISADLQGDLIIPVTQDSLAPLYFERSPALGSPFGKTLLHIQSLQDPHLQADVLACFGENYLATLPAGDYQWNLHGHEDSVQTFQVIGKKRTTLKDLEKDYSPYEKPLTQGRSHIDMRWGASGNTKYFSRSSGLPDICNAFSQDKQGRLWSGFRTGLAMFDGNSLTVFTEENGLPSQDIKSLAYDAEKDQLWIGTSNGLASLSIATRKLKLFPSTFANEVSALAVDPKRNCLWAGSQQGNLFMVKEDTVRTLESPSEFGLLVINRLRLHPATDSLFIATTNGLYVSDGEEVRMHPLTAELDFTHLAALHIDQKGDLWLRTEGSLLHYQDEQLRVVMKGNQKKTLIRDIVESPDGTIFAALDFRFAKIRLKEDGDFDISHGLSSPRSLSSLRALMFDSDGNLWLGGADGLGVSNQQLSIAERGNFNYVTASLKGNLFFTKLTQPNGKQGYHSVCRREQDGEVKSYRLFKTPYDLLAINEEEVFAATNKGIIKVTFPDGGNTPMRGPHWPSLLVSDIERAPNGAIWTAGEEGVLCIDGSDSYRYELDSPSLQDIPEKISIAPNGEVAVWSPRGVSLINHETKEIRVLRKDHGLASEVTYCAEFDSRGHLWIGTRHGLQRYDSSTGQFKNFDSLENGLEIVRVAEIVEDSNGILWLFNELSSQVARYDGTVFQNFPLSASSGSSVFRNFVTQGSKVWFTTNNHLLVRNHIATPPYLELRDIRSNVSQADLTEVKTDTSHPNLEFTLRQISLKTQPGDSLHRYRLLGYEDDWLYTRKSTISYPDLPRGDYTFEAQAIDSELNYSNTLSIPVKVSLPIWDIILKAALAILALICLAFLVAYFLRNTRARKQLENTVEQKSSALREEEKKNEIVQEQLRHAQKMEAVGTLAGGLAHDFNNLLTGIAGNLEIAQSDPLNSAENLSSAESASRRASELVKQLLGFSRKTKLNLRHSSVAALINELRQLIAPVFDEEVKVTLQIEDDLPLVNMDSTQIEQVLLNLCCNARDAMDGPGEINIAAKAISGPSDTEQIEILVSDNGSGMPNSIREKIFEPFFTTKDQGKGTGLGLSMAYGIIEQHGGSITCKSEVEQGSLFRITLPALKRGITLKKEAPLGITDLQKLGGPETILVVDDESGCRTVAAGILLRSGYQVETADCGQAALAILDKAELKIDAVILDVTMPGMSGKEVLVEIVKQWPHIPVIICSGHPLSPESLKKEIGVQPASTIQKPYKLQDLLHTLRLALNPESQQENLSA